MHRRANGNAAREYPSLPRTGDLSVKVPDGQDYSIHHLTASLDGREFNVWVFEPDKPQTDEMTVYAYGFGENDASVENEAHELAALGLPVTLHGTSRRQPMPSPLALLCKPRLRKQFIRHAQNPLIQPSAAISRTMDSVQKYSSKYKIFAAKCHSMGGLTGIMLACHDDRINTLHLDGSAGIVMRNALLNHVKNPVELVKDEIIPASRYLKEYGPIDGMKRSLDHVKDDPLRLLREMAFLILRRPDISRGLEELRVRDVTVIVVSHELDRFFLEHDMEKATRMLVERGLVTYYHQSKGTKHTHVQVRPKESAALYRDTLRLAAGKRQSARIVNH